MKACDKFPLFIQGSVLKLVVLVSFALLCVDTAWAQSCPVSITPGETQTFDVASGGNSGGTGGTSSVNQGYGEAFPDENQMEAVSYVEIKVGSGSGSSGFAEIYYEFCVQSAAANDSVTANISSQIYWNGVFNSFQAGQDPPSASVTMALYDLGPGGSQPPILVNSTTPLSTISGQGSIFSIVSGGANSVTSSQPGVLDVNVITGHVYQIQYTLNCNSPVNGVSIEVTCNFGSSIYDGLQAFECSGGCFAQVSSVTVTLGNDIFGATQALQQSLAANNLTMEQENAQLLGVLNKLESQLSKSQPADPPPPASNMTPPKSPNSACSSSSDSGHTGGFLYRWFSALFKRQQACP